MFTTLLTHLLCSTCNVVTEGKTEKQPYDLSLTINVSLADGEHGYRLGEGQGHGRTAVSQRPIPP